jgi:RNA polymerase sigma-70 factor (ECF subfamily)
MEDPQELLEGLKRRDEAAFKKVMALYKDRIYTYLRMLTGDAALAEELAQDTFVKVYFKGHTLKTDNLKSWIFTIATNLARSHFRRHRLGRLFSLEDVSEKHLAVEYRPETGPVLEALLGRLPEKYRVPLVMRELDNFSFAEIAEVMQKPVGTIKTLVFRGKKQLQEALRPPPGGIDNGTV